MSIEHHIAWAVTAVLLSGGSSCRSSSEISDMLEPEDGSTGEVDLGGPESSGSGEPREPCRDYEIIEHGDHPGSQGVEIGGCEEHRWWITHLTDGTRIDVRGSVEHDLEGELVWPTAGLIEACDAPIDSMVGAATLTLTATAAGELQLRVRNPRPSASSYEVVRRCEAEACARPVLRFPALMVPDWGPLGQFSADVGSWASEQTTPVEFAELPQFEPPEGRALLLQDEVELVLRQHCARKVNLLAFGQGGLDARVLISSYGRYDAVASLLTVGAPHGGTPLAGEGTAAFFFDLMGIDPVADTLESWSAMSPVNLASFDIDNPDHPQVDYLSYIGSIEGCRTLWKWLPFLPEVDNDCIVPSTDAEWGTVVAEGLPVLNHFEQLGYDPCPFELPPSIPIVPEECTIATHGRHLELYAGLLDVLGERGH